MSSAKKKKASNYILKQFLLTCVLRLQDVQTVQSHQYHQFMNFATICLESLVALSAMMHTPESWKTQRVFHIFHKRKKMNAYYYSSYAKYCCQRFLSVKLYSSCDAVGTVFCLVNESVIVIVLYSNGNRNGDSCRALFARTDTEIRPLKDLILYQWRWWLRWVEWVQKPI